MYEPATNGNQITPAADKVVIMTEEYAVEGESGLIEDESDTLSFQTAGRISDIQQSEDSLDKTTKTSAVEAAATDNISRSSEVYSNLDGSPLSMRYHVVVGSFQSETNAMNLCNLLKKQGCNSIVVITNNSKYRVFYYSTNDEADLREHLAEARKIYPDAWMLDTIQ